MLRILIVDDEELARRGVAARLAGHPNVTVVGLCANGFEAVEAIQQHTPDLVFLDVQMPEMNGFDVLAALDPEAMPAVIFITAYDQHALRAFEVHALDYLLKPIDDDRFRDALKRAQKFLTGQQRGSLNQQLLDLLKAVQPERAYPPRFVIKQGGRIQFVRTEAIDWVEAAGDYVCLHVGGKRHLMRETMAAMEARLDPQRFVRIHRSTIVNADRIRELEPGFNGDHVVLLEDGTQLKQSRSYRNRLDALLGDVL